MSVFPLCVIDRIIFFPSGENLGAKVIPGSSGKERKLPFIKFIR